MIDECKNLVRNLGINESVTFTGRLDRTDLRTYYSIADVFVHPAIWQEPFGRTLLEAMSFGIPLIVSNVGAPPQIVENAGLIFKSGDVEDLKRKIELIIDNDKLRKKMIVNCAVTIKKYEPDNIVGKIVELYKTVVGM